MELIISGRHLEISDEIKQYVQERIDHIIKGQYKLTTTRVVMEVQRNWNLVEVHISGKNLDLLAHAKTSDMHSSIDSACDKMATQLRRHYDRVQDHHQANPRDIEIAAAEADLLAAAEAAESAEEFEAVF